MEDLETHGDPCISIVLIVDRQRQRAERCLQALLGQTMVDRMEILLIDLAAERSGPLSGSRHPSVRPLPASRSLSIGELQASGVLAARAPVVAFLEEHCVAHPGWAEATVEALRSDVAAVGGERRNPDAGVPFASLVHLLDDGPWSAPAVPATLDSVPLGNVAYKREVLDRYRENLALYFECEGLLHVRMVRDGLSLRVVPEARYDHEYDGSARALVRRWFWHSCVAGAVERDLEGVGIGRAVVKCLRGLAGTPLFVARILRASHPGRVPLAVSYVHIVVLAPLLRAAGFVLGRMIDAERMNDRLKDCLLNSGRIRSSA